MASAATTPAASAPPAKKGGLLPMLLCAVVAAGGAGGGVWFMTQSKAKPAAHAEEGDGEKAAAEEQESSGHGDEHGKTGSAEGAAQYLPLTPAIVVNLNDDVTMRYLQVDIELMARSNAAIDAATLHMPRIRNTLMLLFTQQQFEDIVTREGKEKLQKDALAAVQAVLKEETGKPRIDALYFTNFVMQ
ncbi:MULTISPECIES: flagellar basal body-associated FliL family protein [Hydrocarboniphaga]|jgi:flagellar FliL protein|uniref:Flagellar protein FliL n=1 Tax=Hydrocarboniphaga effusa AP103 TaxID=1172194 RepID=I8I2S1_9GAMM|nr:MULTISPECIES: flagellar basal body-associated FliL family protein [Hydrocarboniphaga]EIT70241.1 hypothetical protein WQQ_03780 [Hydrocarboniphaga effusa AP103]MDZ4077264.1 flagellar basal body-associated FliL family protein [Hydrocarboniphaga sp.]